MDEALRELVALWWRSVPGAALQGTLALLVAAAFDRLLPHRAPAELREAIWALALAKLVLPPTFASPLALLPLLAPGWAARAARPLSGRLFDRLADPAPWAGAVAALWLIGLLLLATAAFRRSRALARERRARRSAASAGDLETLARAAARLGLRRRPALFRLPGNGSPFVAGLLRPEIHLPAELAGRELEHVLLHELAHLARRDPWRRAAGFAVQLLFWFHPLVPLARRRLAGLAEPACDRRVARALGAEAGAYRRTLVALAARLAGLAPAGPGFLAPPTVLGLRLDAIADGAAERPFRRRLLTATVALALAVGVLPMAAHGDGAARELAERIVRPPGCLQLRFLVLQRLAARSAATAPSTSPGGER